MQTDQIKLNSTESDVAQALEEAERFSAYAGLTGKSAIHVRLLTEEALGMVRGILGDFPARFWLESVKKGNQRLCSICITVQTDVDYERRQELLEMSSSGRNAAAVGIVGKIRNIIELGLQGYDEAARYQAEYGMAAANYAVMGMVNPDTSLDAFYWSLDAYREQVSSMEHTQEAEAAWDELEKSVVSRLADEVRVGIRRNRVDLVVEKLV